MEPGATTVDILNRTPGPDRALLTPRLSAHIELNVRALPYQSLAAFHIVGLETTIFRRTSSIATSLSWYTIRDESVWEKTDMSASAPRLRLERKGNPSARHPARARCEGAAAPASGQGRA